MRRYDQESSSQLVAMLAEVVGRANIVTHHHKQRAFIQAVGQAQQISQVAAVVIPKSLWALWQVLEVCAKADAIIIAQAANTSLTGGATPFGDYDRPVVLISMQSLEGIYLLDDGAEAIALPGATLQQLESKLAPIGREPHSVLGSSCVGASIIGGICNNSGGMLVQRGPAYSEMALFAQRRESGEFELINHLGVDLGDTPKQILHNLQQGRFGEVLVSKATGHVCTNHHYPTKIRDCDAATPARFNNDPSGLFEASGSAGKLIVFAVRVATFAKPKQEQTFYLSTNDANSLSMLRYNWLKSDLELPVLAEYMHKDYNDITLRYGRDTSLSMQRLSASQINQLYRLQASISDRLSRWRLPATLPDRLLQLLSNLLPAALPKSLAHQAQSYQYHLIIKVADDNIAPVQAFLQSHNQRYSGTLHQCSCDEAKKLMVFRSAATAAMFRYYHLNRSSFGELISMDIALPRNAKDWDEVLPGSFKKWVSQTFYLGHFFCHVMHQDYLLKPSADANVAKSALLAFYDKRHIEYPAEHNVGHIYQAKPKLHSFYKKLDPTNSLNPGIGQSAKYKNWRSSPIKEESNDGLCR